MRKITPSERMILESLIFTESFQTIRDETPLQYGEIRDDIIHMYNAGLIEVFADSDQGPASISFYDSDRPENFLFRATRKGMSALKSNRV